MVVQQLLFVLRSWVETYSSLFLLKSVVLKQIASADMFKLLMAQSEISPFSKLLQGAFGSPTLALPWQHRNRWALCQQMCVSSGVRHADGLSWLPGSWSQWGHAKPSSNLFHSGRPWRPKVLVLKLDFTQESHGMVLKLCWWLDLLQKIWLFLIGHRGDRGHSDAYKVSRGL